MIDELTPARRLENGQIQFDRAFSGAKSCPGPVEGRFPLLLEMLYVTDAGGQGKTAQAKGAAIFCIPAVSRVRTPYKASQSLKKK